MTGPPRNALLRWSVVVVALAALLAMLGPTTTSALRYERASVLGGQAWRLLSAHFVHLGWTHWALNAAALVCIALLLGPLLRARQWVGIALASALGVGLGLLAFSPQVGWYVGLSGVLHGLAAAGALALLRRGRGAGWIWLVVLAAKLAWEQWQGPAEVSASLIGGATIVDAHLYGALAGGAAAWVLTRAIRP